MAYTIEWSVPERVIDIHVPTVCDDALLKRIDDDLNALLPTSSQPVTVVYDVREIQQAPSAQAAFKMTYYKNTNLARILTIGMTSNPLLRFLGSLVGRSIGVQMKDFSTLEEARAYIASIEKI